MAAEAKRTSEYEKERGRLVATLFNAVAIAAFFAASVGQFFAPDEQTSGAVRSGLLLLTGVFHLLAQIITYIVFRPNAELGKDERC